MNVPSIVPNLLIIDWDGEFAIPKLNFASIRLSDLSIKESPLTVKGFIRKVLDLAGINWMKKEARALYAALKSLEENGVRSFTWDERSWRDILSRIDSPEIRRFWLNAITIEKREGSDLLEIIDEYPFIRLDCSGLDWNTIIDSLANLFSNIYRKAKLNSNFPGIAIFLDEVHLFAPQRTHEAPADKGLYEYKMLPTMKLIATTGARSGLPLFASTQRLSELDKTISTQIGQNIIAHRVEDVDLERLRFIMGPVAYMASRLPRGYALVKSMALKVRSPVIAKIDRVIDPVSVERDLLSIWKKRRDSNKIPKLVQVSH
jgi:hypothetical protein